ncbi:PIN domain nuclease [Nocardioides marmoriginsengisoli]|uniref:Ribonuclease VapC n=1 Tax=Nocardioides marmoriginsengisoli TaxID=661483 RepID=A0A3N0CQS7_9ACTN|nr:PIN domain nuclease [Nocardioides marmoriginsengisoli]RNL65740.1 PIN domain nuclease [Nocardioides marmoriginsengisoli]
MILVDTSCWVDYLRSNDTPARTEVRRLITEDLGSVVTCEPVAMELLAGTTSPQVNARVEQLVNGLPSLRLDPVVDFRSAAAVQRAARAEGHVVRSIIDCLIAAVAIRHDVELLHKDGDFETITRVTTLRARSLR